AWAEQGAGRTDAALAVLEPYLSGPKARGVDALHAAMIADLAGRDAVAGRDYALAAKDFSGPNLRLARVLASWQARQGETTQAQSTLGRLAENNSDLAMILPDLEQHMARRPVASATDGMAEAYLALAASLRQKQAADLPVIMLRLALQLRPDLAPARLLLADIYDAHGHPATALKVLAAVSEADPLAGLIDLRRATLLADAGKADDALNQLDRLARRYPNRPEPLEVKGDLLRGDGHWSAAIEAYSGAIATLAHPGSNDWSLYYDRGIAYDQVHDWPRAQADFQTALKLAPDQPYVLNYLGYSWAVQGRNLTEARRMVATAAKLRPDDGAILDSLGYVMLRQGDTEGAVHWLLKAVTREPDDPTINGHLGDAYWAAGDRLAARYQWQLALSMHPSAKEAAALHSKLGADEGSGIEGGAVR
ncbi:MAG: tetratricopeptide repeat protein, partial [Acetobacteraceae bacterium]